MIPSEVEEQLYFSCPVVWQGATSGGRPSFVKHLALGRPVDGRKTAASPSGLVSFRNTPIKLTARVLIALLIACLFCQPVTS